MQGHHIKLLNIHFSIAIIQGAIISNHQSVVSIQDSSLTFDRPRSTFPSSEELQGIISNCPICSSVVSRSSSSGLAVSKALSCLHHHQHTVIWIHTRIHSRFVTASKSIMIGSFWSFLVLLCFCKRNLYFPGQRLQLPISVRHMVNVQAVLTMKSPPPVEIRNKK